MSTEDLRREIDTCHRKGAPDGRPNRCVECSMRWPCDIGRISETLSEACDTIDCLERANRFNEHQIDAVNTNYAGQIKPLVTTSPKSFKKRPPRNG